MNTPVSAACDDEPIASTPVNPERPAIDSADRGRLWTAVLRRRRRPCRLEPAPWIGWY